MLFLLILWVLGPSCAGVPLGSSVLLLGVSGAGIAKVASSSRLRDVGCRPGLAASPPLAGCTSFLTRPPQCGIPRGWERTLHSLQSLALEDSDAASAASSATHRGSPGSREGAVDSASWWEKRWSHAGRKYARSCCGRLLWSVFRLLPLVLIICGGCPFF